MSYFSLLALRHRSLCGVVLACTLSLAAACDDSSSNGTTGGGGGLTGVTGGLPAMDSGVPGLDAGTGATDSGLSAGDGGMPAVSEDSGIPGAPDGSTGDPALDALLGDYLLEFHTISRGENASLGEVTTNATSYGVLRVVAEGGALVGSEYLCFNYTDQTAANGTISTTVSDQVWQNLTPVRRSLVVDTAAGTWSSPGAMRRQGWRETAASMPTDPVAQKDDFLDPDLDGRPGVATRVTGEATILIATVTADCEYDLVSATTTSYAGTLSAEGLPQNAQITAESSQVHALTANQVGGTAPCAASDINSGPPQTTDVDELRMVRVDGVWLPQPGACPSEAEFQAALP